MKTRVFAMMTILCMVLLGCGTMLQAEENTTGPGTLEVETTPLQLVRVDDTLYYNTFEESTVEGRCGVMDGEIVSTVPQGEIPGENDQSNFGTGFGYQMGFEPDSVEVVIEGKFVVFRALYPENSFGITMEASSVTPTGMTVICTRADMLSDWEVTTGSPYGLSVLSDGTWKSYVRSDGLMVDYMWTMEAWVIDPGQSYQWEVDWEWLYGELPPGTYRFGKTFNAVERAEGEPNSETFGAFTEFTVE